MNVALAKKHQGNALVGVGPPSMDLLIDLVDQVGSVSAVRRAILNTVVAGYSGTAPAEAKPEEKSELYPLRPGWCWMSGADVFSFVTSGSRGWAQYYADKGPLFLRIGNLDYESIELDLEDVQRVRPPAGAEGTRTKVQPGDILISITGDTGMVGLVREGLGDAYINQHIALARPVPALLPEFVARVLTAPAILGAVQSAQRGIKNSLGLDDIRELRLPIPPLPEQKRIVAKVDQLMALCDELEAKQAKKRKVGDRLTKAALAALTSAETPEEFKVAWKRVAANLPILVDIPQAVTALRRALRVLAVTGRLATQDLKEGRGTDLVNALRADLSAHDVEWHETDREAICSDAGYVVPAAWAWVRLRNLALFGPSNGFSPKAVEFKTATKSLTLTATTSGRFDGQHSKYLDVKIESDSPLWLEDGDLLIQRSNTIDYVGAAAIFRGPSKTFIHPDLMMKVRLSTQVEEEWIHTVLWAEPTRAYFRQRASGTAGSMPKINQSVVGGTPIPLPPRREQRRILERMHALMAICDELEAALKKRDVGAQHLAEALVSSVATPSHSVAT